MDLSGLFFHPTNVIISQEFAESIARRTNLPISQLRHMYAVVESDRHRTQPHWLRWYEIMLTPRCSIFNLQKDGLAKRAGFEYANAVYFGEPIPYPTSTAQALNLLDDCERVNIYPPEYTELKDKVYFAARGMN